MTHHQINSFWNLGFLLGITIILQIITGIFLGLHYTSDLNSAYSSVFFFIREIYYGWCLRYLHSSGASFVFLFLFLHLGRAISYGSYFYNPNTWFSGILIFFFLMTTAFMGYVLPFGQMSFWESAISRPKNWSWACYPMVSAWRSYLSFFHFINRGTLESKVCRWRTCSSQDKDKRNSRRIHLEDHKMKNENEWQTNERMHHRPSSTPFIR